jgi:hypothetical protein
MDLTPYLTSVRAGVANAAALADQPTQDVAERLATAIESTTRLALIQALSDAASTISVELAPSSVELRMAGPDPEFAVTVHPSDSTPTYLLPDPEPGEAADGPLADGDDEPLARITLRLPQSVKLKVDELAAADGISTNAWLVAALTDALASRGGHPDWPGPPPPPRPPHPPSPAPVFGPHGPFGPHGVFGVNGPFGVGGLFAGKSSRAEGQPREERGHVQGWVR